MLELNKEKAKWWKKYSPTMHESTKEVYRRILTGTDTHQCFYQRKRICIEREILSLWQVKTCVL
jgi:hypothetical protein